MVGCVAVPTPKSTRKSRSTTVKTKAGVDPDSLASSSETSNDTWSAAIPNPQKPRVRKPSRREARVPLDAEQLQSTPYPTTDISENRAITILLGLLNEARIKAEFQRRDKRPNTDGYIDLVDDKGYSVGQLDVQIRTLSGNNLKARSYPCEPGLLGYCYHGASRQVLLIGVDITGRQAFWAHLSREYISQLQKSPSSATVSVKFPPENTISRDESYIEKWTVIVKEHARRIYQLDPKPSELVAEEKSIALLIQDHTLAVDSYKPEFVPLQEFLDEFNRLLDNEFRIVKKILFPNAWKAGIAFSHFTKDGLTYSLFPITRGHNETLIRQVDASIWMKLRHRHIHTPHGVTVLGFSSNPILDNPIKQARARACALGKNLIKARALHLNNLLLARELIFSAVDHHGVALGLPRRNAYQNVYQVDKLASAFYDYLPRWVEYALETLCPDHNIPAYLCGPDGDVDLDDLRSFFSSRAATISASSLHRLIKKRKAPSQLPPFGSVRYPLGMFRHHLSFLAEESITSVQRLYTEPTNLRNVPMVAQSPSELWLPNDFARNFKLVMSHVVETYNNVIAHNFPLLQKSLSFFRGFERKIVLLLRGQAGWNVLDYELSNPNSTSQSMDIYCEGIDILPSLGIAPEIVKLDGLDYTVNSESISICDMNFFRQPLLQTVCSVVEERFDDFTKEWLAAS